MQFPWDGFSKNFPPEQDVQLAAAYEHVAQNAALSQSVQLSPVW